MENAGIVVDLAAAKWRKSRRSSGGGGNCIEVAAVTGVKDGKRQPLIAVRDSKNPNHGVLGFTKSEFAAFVGGVCDGDFDDLT